MKVLMFTDCHLTTIKGLQLFAETSLKCIESILNYAEKQDIDTIWFLGDFFYHKAYVELFLLPMARPTMRKFQQFNTKFIVGNHDIVQDLSQNNHNLLESFGDYIDIVRDPYEHVEIDGNNFYFVNYNNNHLISSGDIKRAENGKHVLLCHIDCNGFLTNSKHEMRDARINLEDLSGFDLVFSGHYHRKSRRGNLQYIGSTHHMRRLDVGNPFGFTVLDTETLEYSFHTYDDFKPPCFVEYNITELDTIKSSENNFLRITLTPEQDKQISQSSLLQLRDFLYEKGNHHVMYQKLYSEDFESTEKDEVPFLPGENKFTTDHREFYKIYLQSVETKLDKEKLVNILCD